MVEAKSQDGHRRSDAVNGLTEFMAALFRPEDGFIELRALPSRARVFVTPGFMYGIECFANEHLSEDVYFGVASRIDESSGALDNCSKLRALFVDIDFKTFPSEIEARKRLSTFPLKPSIVVRSGGGFHCYWRLVEPIDLKAGGKDKARELLRRLAIAVGGDLSAAEPARILRLPGTYNHKYQPTIEVKVCTDPTH